MIDHYKYYDIITTSIYISVYRFQVSISIFVNSLLWIMVILLSFLVGVKVFAQISAWFTTGLSSEWSKKFSDLRWNSNPQPLDCWSHYFPTELLRSYLFICTSQGYVLGFFSTTSSGSMGRSFPVVCKVLPPLHSSTTIQLLKTPDKLVLRGAHEKVKPE